MNSMSDALPVNIIFQEKNLCIIKQTKCEKPIALAVTVIGSEDLIQKWEDIEV